MEPLFTVLILLAVLAALALLLFLLYLAKEYEARHATTIWPPTMGSVRRMEFQYLNRYSGFMNSSVVYWLIVTSSGMSFNTGVLDMYVAPCEAWPDILWNTT